MSKMIVAFFFGLVTLIISDASANTTSNNGVKEMVKSSVQKKPYDQLTPSERMERAARGREKRARRLGGLISIANSRHGKIVFVNAQKSVLRDIIDAVVTDIRLRDNFNIELIDEPGASITPLNANAKKHKLGADIVVYLIECGQCDNLMLTAPESGWSIVNATAICKDAKNDAFKKTRMIKMIQRGYYCAAGAMNSQYPNSLMGSVRTTADIDKLSNDPPMDVVSRTLDALEAVGVTPQAFTNYRKACQEGWAPAPTNDIQRAIWDQVHAIPKNPMKIEFDPKKGR